MDALKGIGVFAGIFVAIFCVGMLFQGQDFIMYKFWAPKYANVQREVFENTKSYQQGMIQDLRKSQEEYVQADSTEKYALAGIILKRVADVPEENIPADLQLFLRELRALKAKPLTTTTEVYK
jgi:hypothetical protein